MIGQALGRKAQETPTSTHAQLDMEQAARDLTLDESEDIRAVSDAYDEIRSQALPIEMSKRLIEQIMEERWSTT